MLQVQAPGNTRLPSVVRAARKAVVEKAVALATRLERGLDVGVCSGCGGGGGGDKMGGSNFGGSGKDGNAGGGGGGNAGGGKISFANAGGGNFGGSLISGGSAGGFGPPAAGVGKAQPKPLNPGAAAASPARQAQLFVDPNGDIQAQVAPSCFCPLLAPRTQRCVLKRHHIYLLFGSFVSLCLRHNLPQRQAGSCEESWHQVGSSPSRSAWCK